MHYENIPFKVCGSIAVLCDLWTPETKPEENGWPLVIFYHGGGWLFGDKSGWGLIRRWQEGMLAKGIAFATAGYRHKGYGGQMPGTAADCADAVRFFRKNAAEYGIDPERILLSGHSAGAHLCLLIALTGDKFRDEFSDKETECKTHGAVSVSGTANLNFSAYDKPEFHESIYDCVRALLGERWNDPDALAEVEPIRYVEREEAPKVHVLMVQPQEDQIVPPAMAVELCQVAAEKGYDIRHLPLEATGHCLETPETSDPSPATLAADNVVLDFIAEILGVEK